MPTTDDPLVMLRRLGYLEREAAFLHLVAVHSGYFIRRQYADFLGQKRGRPDADLVEKVLRRGHARPLAYAYRPVLYHLCTRRFYRAIRQPENRHRRERSPSAIRAKLMALDYVLAHPGRRFLGSEKEKVTFFTEELGIDRAKLPSSAYAGTPGHAPV